MVKKKLDELEAEVRKNVEYSSKRDSDTYDRIKYCLKFVSGDQYSDGRFDERDDNRPSNVLNYCKKFIKRIVNPTRKTPYQVDVNLEEPDQEQDVTVRWDEPYQDALDESINATEGRECLVSSFYTSVAAGLGWLIPITEYKSNKSTEQRIRLQKVLDPTTVYAGPHIRDDGSDMNWAFVLTWLDKDFAVEKYGADVLGSNLAESLFSGLNKREDEVPELIYYRREAQVKHRYFKEGGYTDEKEELKEKPEDSTYRKVRENSVKICHFVGEKYINSTDLDIEFIPVIPVKGEVKYTDDKIIYNGLIDELEVPQMITNFYSNKEFELAGSSPLAQFVMAAGQDEGFEEEWRTNNVKPHARLRYNPTAGPDGLMLPPPTRIDNTAQTQGVIGSKVQSVNDMAGVVSMPDEVFGVSEYAGQSAQSVLLRQNAAEIPNADFQDNFEKSMLHCAVVITQMKRAISTEPVSVPVETKTGKERIEINLQDSQFDIADLQYDADQGPRNDSDRKQSTAFMLEISDRAPNLAYTFADLLAESTGTTIGKKVAERIRKSMDPKLLDDNKVDPKLEQMAQAAQQTINEYENLVSDLQAENEQLKTHVDQQNIVILSSKEDNNTKIEVQKIKSVADVKVAELKGGVEIEKAEISAESKAGSDAVGVKKETLKIAADAENKIIEIAERAVENTPSIEIESTEHSIPRKTPKLTDVELEVEKIETPIDEETNE